MRYTERFDSPLGEILLASDGEALTGLWFAGQKYEAAGLSACAEARALPVFDAARRWLERYFSGRAPVFLPPLNPSGTPFQRAVWAELSRIPYGRTSSYGEIAARIGCASARAVGAAVGRNPISILIPCHRALGADGKLTGYAGGVERKRYLLELERGQ